MVNKYRSAPPKAGVLVEALRGLGYSTTTALSDIIDNSITAHAQKVDVVFYWSGPSSTIIILDDGCGMDDPELFEAMRLGAKSPLDARVPDDLGRFGLGLKTASFSQCRRLTVASRKDGIESCLQWDLDLLANSHDDGWPLIEGPANGSEGFLELLSSGQGTLVIWEKLDRIVTPGFSRQNFLDLIDRVESHLSMVFHRFICGSQPKLQLSINGRIVKPWDPFLVTHSATWSSPTEKISSTSGVVEVRCHVLPHRDRLDPKLYDIAAGPDGWTAQQGFYVYRNERLLVAGSWLGLGRGRSWTKEESHRLARIRIDIQNSADIEWDIDVRKSTARPPVAIRDRLVHLAEDTRDRARRVFAYRGSLPTTRNSEPLIQAWRVDRSKDGIRYRIDHNHPAVSAVMKQSGEACTLISNMLRIIEETVPIQRIWLDTAENKDVPKVGFKDEASPELIEILNAMYHDLVFVTGMEPQVARNYLSRSEPFNFFPQLVNALPDKPVW